MTGISKRQQKFSRQLQKDLSSIFQKELSGAFKGAFITITGVEISPDLSVARIYLSFMLVDDPKVLLEEIRSKTSQIRGALGRMIGKQVRIVPELVFFHDNSAEEGARIDRLISGLDIPPAPEDNEDQNN
jgi:ribosome-binding factor A